MGVDLTLLPVQYENDVGDLICTVAMDLDMSRSIGPFFELTKNPILNRVIAPLATLPERIIPLLTEDEGYYFGGPWYESFFGIVNEDGYGNRLQYVLAKDARKAFEDAPEALSKLPDFEIAAIRYISALKDSRKIVLYWW